MPVEFVKLVAGEDGTGRVVGVRQVDDLRLFSDGGGERRQVVPPVLIRHCPVSDSTRLGQDTEADKRVLGRQHLIIVQQEGANNIRHDAFASAARNDVFDLYFIQFGQAAAQAPPLRWGRS